VIDEATAPVSGNPEASGSTSAADADALLAWYDRHARRLPWRVGPRERARGVRPDPYRVWLSEVMLQQTTVAAVKPYFETFVRRWPDVAALAAATREEVMKAWAGLGYYARARNLKACAERIVNDYGGRFPETAAALRALPGIGDYTAAAIAAIAFDEPAVVVDGNIERVIARLEAIDVPLPGAKATIRDIQRRLTPSRRAGDYAQALMDLGATVCTPKRPGCSLCPWSGACSARAAGNPEGFPIKATKEDRPTRRGAAFVAVRRDGAILLRRRSDRGLLGGMTEVPCSEWTSRFDDVKAVADAPVRAEWHRVPAVVTHVFTHFRLGLVVFRADLPQTCKPPAGAWWAPSDSLAGEALPSVMRKVVEAAVPGATMRSRGRAA
jgi:A/G-specific adenine glycosylase